MAKNRRKLIDDVKRALGTLPANATDRDFRPLLDYILAAHVAAPAKAKVTRPTARQAAAQEAARMTPPLVSPLAS